MIGNNHPLYAVNDVFNAIMVKGNVLGPVMFYGSGAGKLPTASAVVSDIVDAIKHLNDNVEVEWTEEKLSLTDFNESVKKFFVRVKATTELADVQNIFGQVEKIEAGVDGEYAFITDAMSEADFNSKVENLEGFITRIRVQD